MKLNNTYLKLFFLMIVLNFGEGNAMKVGFEIEANGVCHIEDVKYPAVGFGTYPLRGDQCFEAVVYAFEEGYRIIDTATFYQNFIPIGKALKKCGRENCYIISKVWPDSQTAERLKADLETTLKQLQTSYLDAYLIHWPNSNIPIEETLKAMEEVRTQGKIRHIGFSNVNVNHLKRALELDIPISWVQVEMHPFFYDATLLDFCKENGIVVQAWAPLARGRVSKDPFLKKIGNKYGKTASQVAIKWILQHGSLPLPGSQNKTHIQENFKVADFTLTKEEMKAIDDRAKKGKRERVTAQMGIGFTDEFDYSYEQCWPKEP